MPIDGDVLLPWRWRGGCGDVEMIVGRWKCSNSGDDMACGGDVVEIVGLRWRSSVEMIVWWLW